MIELLAPGGDLESIKAAISAGADAIYCGLDKFNARNRAVNISFEELQGVIKLAHSNNCKIYLTLNILFTDAELPSLFNLLNDLANTKIDGLIIQDLGLAYILNQYFDFFEVHASTQLTTHNVGQIKFLNRLKVERVNLSRELNITEIEELVCAGNDLGIGTEVFIHGSYCISFSGLCYFSSFFNGRSGNRGRCSQPCRNRYKTTAAMKNYPLNLKDNSAFTNLRELVEIGVSSLKIEGRIKKYDYVYTIVESWRKHIDNYYKSGSIGKDDSKLYKVFNREFSNGFLVDKIDKFMFTENPRDNSIKRFYNINSDELLNIYNEKNKILSDVEEKIKKLSISKIYLRIKVYGKNKSKLIVKVITPTNSFFVYSNEKLTDISRSNQVSNMDALRGRLNGLDNDEYQLKEYDTVNLKADLFIPFQELSQIKQKIIFKLNNSLQPIAPVRFPKIEQSKKIITTPKLSIIVSSYDDAILGKAKEIEVIFSIPNCLTCEYDKLLNLFDEHSDLIPLFPSILIGRDYFLAVKLLNSIKFKKIITNNLGIAMEAYLSDINWIGGPNLNLTNSFSLKCIKELYSCSGAYISNELGIKQLKRINPPDNFQLNYLIYGPILLMTSRQCFFHQITGCEKVELSKECVEYCKKSALLSTNNSIDLLVLKEENNFNSIYSSHYLFNPDIIKDLNGVFSGFTIDLRDIETSVKTTVCKGDLIDLFCALVNYVSVDKEVKDLASFTTNVQYFRGI